jgi:hypothetical protein
MTVLEIIQLEREMPTKKREAARACTDQTLQQFLESGVLLDEDWMREALYLHTELDQARGMLVVDLELPNHILKTQFEEWLTEMRTSESDRSEETFRNHYWPSRETWVSIGLLPCMDLLIWELQNQKKILMRNLAFAIHNGDVTRQDSIRKSTLPLAAGFLEGSYRADRLLRSLLAEAAIDLMEPERARRRISNRIKRKKDKSA